MDRGCLLIVDDEVDITTALASLLGSSLKADVRVANSGADALKLLEGADVVLTDFKMPGMDGLELLREIGKRAPDVSRILMTAFPDVELAVQALNEGQILHFLSKPLEPDEIREVLGAILAERLARKHRDAALARSLAEMKRRGRVPASNGR